MLDDDDLGRWKVLEKQYVKSWFSIGQGVRHRAKEMDITVAAAKRMRLRYLREQLIYWGFYMEGSIIGAYVPRKGFEIPHLDVGMIVEEMLRLLEPEVAYHVDTITDDMKMQAKAYPIDQLLDFKWGKIRCINPAHEDSHPTMFNGNRTNKAKCPACQASYDAIEIIKIQEGVSFSRAVQILCSR